jgi:phosphatidylserine/phosphatidylglycerophosphate/cardiolipin synthase-like enzyme
MSLETTRIARASDYCDCFGVSSLLCFRATYEADDDEAVDKTAAGLSYVGRAAYEVLRTQHNRHHHTLWNVTRGTLVSFDPSPKQVLTGEAVSMGHSDWLPKKMADLICRTEVWCDVTSLEAPDGLFLTCFKAALTKLHEKNKPITFRLLVGNVVGRPTNCTAVVEQLTSGIPKTTKLRVWVGAWRKSVSWNHSKIIAVDGHILYTGGHNLRDGHYLQHDPVSDLSMHLEGRVANDGHYYANDQWRFVQHMQRSLIGWFVDKLPDGCGVTLKSRVTVTEFPTGVAKIFPPMYDRSVVVKAIEGRTGRAAPKRREGAGGGGGGRPGPGRRRDDVKDDNEPTATDSASEEIKPSTDAKKSGGDTLMISMGRYGTLTRFKRRPADDAIVAMILSAKKYIHLALQDLGPVCIPGTKIPLPGCTWPKPYLSALGRVIWTKGVEVEIVLSNPGSVPGGLSKAEAFGNGWSCSDVASEIIKTIKANFPEADDEKLKQKLLTNLRVSFLRSTRGQKWEDGMTLALHAKHMIIDQAAFLVGSQNLYVCDLAEWGVLVDNEEETKKVLREYWEPMWRNSYTADDCNLHEVMEGLSTDRNGEDPDHVSAATQKLLDEAENKHLLESGQVRPSRKGKKYFEKAS